MAWIDRCFKSVINSTIPVTIICIDNCSADGTAGFIRKYFPQVNFIQSEKNLGFGQANNIGLRLSVINGADYVFLLNQDAAVEPGTIETLINIHTLHYKFGVISPVHLNGSGTSPDRYFLQYLSVSQIPPGIAPDKLIGEKHDLLVTTTFVNAAAWLLSIECIKKTGGFDPIFFHYGEDGNYLQRVHYKGFKTGIYLGCCIYHDRETQIAAGFLSANQQLKKEWTFFLTNACNINKTGYKLMMVKRFLRHGLLALESMIFFQGCPAKFHVGMAKNILFHFKAVGTSRALAKANVQPPFL